MEFIETPVFSKLLHDYLSDDEYAALQWYLISNPECGDVIRGSGGLRKVRWRGSGRGKSGGVRVIYYYKSSKGEIWLLTIYAKNEAEKLPISILREIKKEIDQ